MLNKYPFVHNLSSVKVHLIDDVIVLFVKQKQTVITVIKEHLYQTLRKVKYHDIRIIETNKKNLTSKELSNDKNIFKQNNISNSYFSK